MVLATLGPVMAIIVKCDYRKTLKNEIKLYYRYCSDDEMGKAILV